jgi:hypothetical protein
VGAALKARQGKIFFSEEKKQKTSDSLSRFYPAAHAESDFKLRS